MAEDIKDWSTTAASNDTADTAINWQEGQAPSTVNNSGRSMMVAVKKWWDESLGGLSATATDTGAADAYAIAPAPAITAYTKGQMFHFFAVNTNTGASTVNVNALGTKAIQKNAVALAGGEIGAGDLVSVVYDGANFQLLNNPRINEFETLRAFSQPSFLAYKALADGTQANVTGAGTAVTVTVPTELFDVGSDFNTSTSTHTAPVTGRYLYTVGIYIQNLTSAMTQFRIELVTSNRAYILLDMHGYNVMNGSNSILISQACYADMDASDTAYIRATVSNGASDSVDITEGASPLTFFSGHLLS